MGIDLKNRRSITLIAAAIAAAILIVVYGAIDPAGHFFPRCPFRMLTGFDCPGCGSQRAIHCLLNGDIAGAWSYNAMLVVAIPVLAVLFAASAMRDRCPRFYKTVNSPAVIYTIFAAIILWWLLRNLL